MRWFQNHLIIFVSSQKPSEQLLLSELQVLLAEKRTSFSVFRTGLGIVVVPLSIILFLIATNSYHGLFNLFWLGLIVIGGLVAISLAGIFIIAQSWRKVHHINKLVQRIERQNKRIDEIIV